MAGSVQAGSLVPTTASSQEPLGSSTIYTPTDESIYTSPKTNDTRTSPQQQQHQQQDGRLPKEEAEKLAFEGVAFIASQEIDSFDEHDQEVGESASRPRSRFRNRSLGGYRRMLIVTAVCSLILIVVLVVSVGILVSDLVKTRRDLSRSENESLGTLSPVVANSQSLSPMVSVPSTQPSTVSLRPSLLPSYSSSLPSVVPSFIPTVASSEYPSVTPTSVPTARPSLRPSSQPTSHPSNDPTKLPSGNPSQQPSSRPTSRSFAPTQTSSTSTIPSVLLPSASFFPSTGGGGISQSTSLHPTSVLALNTPSAQPSRSSFPTLVKSTPPSTIPSAFALASQRPSQRP